VYLAWFAANTIVPGPGAFASWWFNPIQLSKNSRFALCSKIANRKSKIPGLPPARAINQRQKPYTVPALCQCHTPLETEN
jgi:hypothetical protein